MKMPVLTDGDALDRVEGYYRSSEPCTHPGQTLGW